MFPHSTDLLTLIPWHYINISRDSTNPVLLYFIRTRFCEAMVSKNYGCVDAGSALELGQNCPDSRADLYTFMTP
jgi:hypothetical protein